MKLKEMIEKLTAIASKDPALLDKEMKVHERWDADEPMQGIDYIGIADGNVTINWDAEDERNAKLKEADDWWWDNHCELETEASIELEGYVFELSRATCPNGVELEQVWMGLPQSTDLLDRSIVACIWLAGEDEGYDLMEGGVKCPDNYNALLDKAKILLEAKVADNK